MRLWSLHPKYLDSKGLVALWRESLLAKRVLEGKTNGYKNHSQLRRFKSSGDAIGCINQYLTAIHEQSLIRGYCFDKSKIDPDFIPAKLTVTDKQIKFEMQHLLKKLKARDPDRFQKLSEIVKIDAHPLFKIIDGDVEEWEIIDFKAAGKAD